MSKNSITLTSVRFWVLLKLVKWLAKPYAKSKVLRSVWRAL